MQIISILPPGLKIPGLKVNSLNSVGGIYVIQESLTKTNRYDLIFNVDKTKSMVYGEDATITLKKTMKR